MYMIRYTICFETAVSPFIQFHMADIGTAFTVVKALSACVWWRHDSLNSQTYNAHFAARRAVPSNNIHVDEEW